jgi:hypothetical protein
MADSDIHEADAELRISRVKALSDQDLLAVVTYLAQATSMLHRCRFHWGRVQGQARAQAGARRVCRAGAARCRTGAGRAGSGWGVGLGVSGQYSGSFECIERVFTVFDRMF